MFPAQEPVLNFFDSILEFGQKLQDLADGLFGGEVSSGPLAEEGFERIGAHVVFFPFTRNRVWCGINKEVARQGGLGTLYTISCEMSRGNLGALELGRGWARDHLDSEAGDVGVSSA